MARRTVEVTGPKGTVMNLDISPITVLSRVLSKLGGDSTAITTTHEDVGALRGDAIDFTYAFELSDISVSVVESRGYIQDTFVFAISATDDAIDHAETLIREAAHELGLFCPPRK